MRRRPAWTVAIVLTLAGWVVSAPVATNARDGVDPLLGASLEFEISSSKPWLRVDAGRLASLSFVVDTGASIGSCLAWSRAEELGLTIQNVREIRAGAGEGAMLRLGDVDSFAIDLPTGSWWARPLVVLDISHVEPYEGRRLDGLLGADLFFTYAVDIDYDAPRLRLGAPLPLEEIPGPEWTVVGAELGRGWPIVEARVDFGGGVVIACSLMVDTGVRQGLVLNSPFVERHALREIGDGFDATIGGGVGGETKGRVTRPRRLELGGHRLEAPVVVLSSDASGAFASNQYDGIVGGPILSRFRVVFDYSNGRILLRPGARFADEFDFDASGMFLRAIPPEFEVFEVLSVASGSPAEEVGLRRGDTIVSVDSFEAGEFTLEQLRALLCQSGTRVRLGVESGPSPARDVVLVTRRLI